MSTQIFEIEFDKELFPNGYKPKSFKIPEIGDDILLFNSARKPFAVRNNGNTYYGPVIVLEQENSNERNKS